MSIKFPVHALSLAFILRRSVLERKHAICFNDVNLCLSIVYTQIQAPNVGRYIINAKGITLMEYFILFKISYFCRKTQYSGVIDKN